jgi:hypothetical protein
MVDQVFLDSSIQIARWVHAPETKRRIADRISQHSGTVTSLVVRQEFKRRLLKEARYLLNQLNHKGSLERVLRHVVDVLPPQQQRKRNICLEMLAVLYEQADDVERTERAKRYLRILLRLGLTDFDNSVNAVIWDSGCACAHFPVEEKIPYKRYEFGPDKCSATGGVCKVAEFLDLRQWEMNHVLEHLKRIPGARKSAELQKTETFLEKVLGKADAVKEMEPCLKAGDLIIAMESADIPVFYTLNSKESQHLCRALKQTLVVRPKNPEREDVVCLNTDDTWPDF